MMKLNVFIIIVFALLLSLGACKGVEKKDTQTSTKITDISVSNNPYVPIKIQQDVTKLIVDITEGNDYDKESVLLISQGGPMPFLVEKEEVGDIIYHYNKKYKTYLVHQAQTYNTDLFTKKMNFDQITRESQISVDMLNKVVKHFREEGKKVYIWGFSFGFFVIENYIAHYGTDDIANAFIGGGRLDMNEVVWHTFRDGGGMSFDEKGIIPIPDGPDSDSEDEEMEEIEEMENMRDVEDMRDMENLGKNIGAMAAGLGQYRYTELLSDKDLSKLIIFYGEIDNVVGTLTKDEVTFLTETLAPEKRPLLIKGLGIGHGLSPEGHEKGKDYRPEIMEALFRK